MEQEGFFIFELLKDHVWFEHTMPDQKGSLAWMVDVHGFLQLSVFAERKQEVLEDFYEDYMTSYFLDVEKEKEKRGEEVAKEVKKKEDGHERN